MKSSTKYISPATCWTEAQPLGNGELGAMVFGGISQEKICLNHDTLWSGVPEKIDVSKTYDALFRAREYIENDDYVNAHRVINENCLGRRGKAYMPFGNLNLSFLGLEDVQGYSRVLDLEKAVLTIDFACGGVNFKREYFVSYPHKVMVIRLSADKLQQITFEAGLESPLKHSVKVCGNSVYLSGECPGFTTEDYKYEYSDKPEYRGIGFCGGMKVLTFGKKACINPKEQSLCVENADEAVLIFSIKTSFNGFNKHPFLEGREYVNELERTLDAAVDLGYEKLFKQHTADFSELFNRVRLDLGKSGREDLPTDERLVLFNKDKADISLYTLLFDFGRYLAISSARGESQIANLQGIWNDSVEPPWSSNFTLNINAEMNQWPLLMCGLEECFQPFVEFMKNVSQSGEYAVKTMYRAKGFVMHSNTDIWLQSTPTAGDARFAFWNGSSGWLCRTLFEYYEYTCDKKFLTDVAYPIMKKAAEFYLDIMTDRGDGTLSVIPSTSPENGFIYDGEENIAVAKWATMSDSIVYDLFINGVKAINEANIDDSEFKRRLEKTISKMKPFAIGTDGRLLEWNEDFEEYEIKHRHVSHLYALHPAQLITPQKTPELACACLKTLEKRGDDGTGWSLAWKVNYWARLNDGNHALKLIDRMLNLVDAQEISYEADGGIYPNLFDAHPPFQIDGNFGVVSGIAEMLVRCEDGEIKFLPALPDKWKNGSLKGLCVKGNKTVDIEWQNNKLVSKEVKEK